jgi:colicin import membrane protein
MFKELRLKIVKNRTQGIEKWHKENKEFFLTGGRFVDAVKNKEVAENDRMESNLLEKEKHFENLEKARLKAVHEERVSKLLPFNYEIGNVDFSGMDENMFNAILTGAETNHKAKIEAERLAEEQRLEAIRLAIEEKEKQRVEMERLKAENEAKEKQLEAERKEAEKIRLAEKAKQDAILAEQKRLSDIEAKKQAEIIAKQKAESERLQAELKTKQQAELKAKRESELKSENERKEAEKLAKAPIKKQLIVWVNSFELSKTELNNDLSLEIKEKFESFKKWSINKVNEL